MISSRAVKILQAYFRVMTFHHAFSYFWDSKKSELIPYTSVRKIIWAIINPIWIFINIIFMLICVVENAMKDASEQYSSWMSLFNLYIVILFISGFLFQINSLVYRHELCALHREILHCHHLLADEYHLDLKEVERHGIDLLSFMFPTILSYFYSMGICLGLLFFVISDAPYYMYSRLPQHIACNTWFKIAWTLWELYQYVNLFAVFTFYLCTMFLYGFMVSFWLKRLKCTNYKFGGLTIKGGIPPLKAIQSYQLLQMVTTSYNNCMRTIATPNVKGIHLTVTILYTYQSIRHITHVPLVIGMMLPAGSLFGIVLIAILYPTIGKVYDLCEDFQRTANKWEGNLLKKKARSLQKYGIYLNNWYPIKRITTLAIMGFFMQSIFNLLIIL